MKFTLYVLALLCVSSSYVFAQDPSSLVDYESSEKGILIPRMTAAEKTSISSPAEGLLIYQTTDPIGFYFFDGTEWKIISGNDTDPSNELQTIDVSQLNGTNLELSLSSDGEATKTIDLSSLQDGTGTDNQNISGSNLLGTNLTIGIEGGSSQVVDLASLQDGTGTDDQTLSEVLTESNDAGANKITNLADPTMDQDAATKKYVDDNVDDADADPTNELQALSDVLTEGNDAGNLDILNVKSLAIGTNTPEASAAVQMDATDKGLLIPRMTNMDIGNIASPAQGLQVYSTDDNCIHIYDGSKWLMDCALSYNSSPKPPLSYSWRQINDFLGSARNGAVSFTIGDKAYVGTGRDPFKNDFYEFDSNNNTWTQIADFPGIPRDNAVAFSINGMGYVGLGAGSGIPTDFYKYDPNSNSWSSIASFPSDGRIDAVAFVINGKAYVGSGNDLSPQNVTSRKDFYEYDPIANTWIQIADIPGLAITDAVAFSIGNLGYVGIGNDFINAEVKDFYSYDPTMDVWTSIADFPVSYKTSAVAFTLGNEAYVGLGNGLLGRTQDFYKYNVTSNTWTAVENFIGSSRTGSVAFSIGLKAFVGLGFDSSSAKSDFYCYCPESYIQKIDTLGVTNWSIGNGLSEVLSIGSDAGNQKINNLMDPALDQDAATKKYVDDNVDDADADPTNELQALSDVLTEDNDAGNLDILNVKSLAIGINTLEASAAVQMDATDKGLLIPRMTNMDIGNIASPAQGLQVYSTDDNCIHIYDGSKWLMDCALSYQDSTTPPPTNEWCQLADFPGGERYSSVSFTIGNDAYVGTGINSSFAALQDFYKYDGTTKTWSSISPYPTVLYDGIAFSIGNKGYVGSGFNNTGFNDKFYEYDPTMDSWTEIAPFPGASRSQAVAFTLGNFGYVGTGLNFGSNLSYKDFYKYDPSMDSWTAIADFTGIERYSAVSFTIDGKAYVGTGSNFPSNTLFQDFYEYDPALDDWTAITNYMGSARYGSVAFTYNGEGYVGTGFDGNYKKDFYKYDPVSNAWLIIPEFIGGERYEGIAFNVNGVGYVVGGGEFDGTATFYNDVNSYCFEHYIAKTNSQGETEWGLSPDLSDILSRGNDAGNQKINNLMDPALDQDAATKKYVDDNDAFLSVAAFTGWLANASDVVSMGDDLEYTNVQQNSDTDIFDMQANGDLVIKKAGVISINASASGSRGAGPTSIGILVNGASWSRGSGSNGLNIGIDAHLVWAVQANDIISFDHYTFDSINNGETSILTVQWTGVK